VITRAELEQKSRAHAGVIREQNDYKLVTILRDIPIYIMKDDKSVGPHLESDGFWEAWISTWFLNNINENTNFVDIGSNTGYYSLLAASKGASVVAFEANPKYVKMLRYTTVDYDNFNVWNYAVSDKREKLDLQIPYELQGSATITGGIDEEIYPCYHIEVEADKLDNLGITAENAIIKIDAEGAEERIWNGMSEVLKNKPTIVLEYTPNSYSDEFIDKLEAYAPLRWINYDGIAQGIDRYWLAAQTDWVMLVLIPEKDNN
jgi:FkbM family methyltransferase